MEVIMETLLRHLDVKGWSAKNLLNETWEQACTLMIETDMGLEHRVFKELHLVLAEFLEDTRQSVGENILIADPEQHSSTAGYMLVMPYCEHAREFARQYFTEPLTEGFLISIEVTALPNILDGLILRVESMEPEMYTQEFLARFSWYTPEVLSNLLEDWR